MTYEEWLNDVKEKFDGDPISAFADGYWPDRGDMPVALYRFDDAVAEFLDWWYEQYGNRAKMSEVSR